MTAHEQTGGARRTGPDRNAGAGQTRLAVPRMRCDLATVALLETFTLAALPARTSWELAGWWCVADDGGHVGRANSATALPEGDASPATLRAVTASYRERGLRPKVRWTPLAPASLAREAVQDGWDSAGEVVVMLAGCQAADGAGTTDAAATSQVTSLLDEPDTGWAGVYLDANADGSGQARLRLAAGAPESRKFVTVKVDGDTAAIGLGVVIDDVLGIFDVVTAPRFRRRGLGRHVVTTLMGWGAAQGAATAFLQVHGGNVAALALYGSLGFATGYTYVYLAPHTG